MQTDKRDKVEMLAEPPGTGATRNECPTTPNLGVDGFEASRNYDNPSRGNPLSLLPCRSLVRISPQLSVFAFEKSTN